MTRSYLAPLKPSLAFWAAGSFFQARLAALKKLRWAPSGLKVPRNFWKEVFLRRVTVKPNIVDFKANEGVVLS